MQQKICCSLAGDEPARNANVVVIRNGLIGQSTFKNVKIIAHPYTHNFPIFKHPAGVEPAPPVWKTGVISVRPRMQKIIFFQIFLYSIFRACYICNAEIRIVGGCLPKF